MGQASSKAAATLSRASKRIRGDVPRKDFEYSPTRGQGPDAPKMPDKMPEMPEDLIKFLQSTGPLERVVDKELTSPKVYDSLISDEKARDEQAKKANERVRRRMPIISGAAANATALDAMIGGVGAGEIDAAPATLGEEDGTMTTRTTNFSTVDRSNKIEGFGVDRRTLFDMSMKLDGKNTNSDEWKKLVGEEFKLLVSEDNIPRSEEQMDKDLALLQNTMRFISIPVLMRDTGDTDEDVIGIKPERLEDLKVSGLKMAKKNSLKFILLDEEKAL